MANRVQSGLPHLAAAADILHWSDRIEARTEFPRLIRRLIQENNDQVVRIEMRAAEGAGVPGFDGIVEATRGTAFVPQGTSCWELGVGVDPQNKANRDYRKRTDELGASNSSAATFVFVTSRRWGSKRTWEDEKRAEGRWHDVRAFDVDDIEHVLEDAPAVHVWFSEIIGKPARGAQSIEDWWNQFASRTNPSLTPELVLAGRVDSAAELIQLLTQNRSFTTIGAASIDDDLAFVAATILSAEEDLQSKLLGRTLVVRDPEFLKRLDGVSHLLLLVPIDRMLRTAAESVRGHQIAFLGDDDSPADIALPSIESREFAQQLAALGVGAEDAERLALAAHRSLRRFQRLASPTGSIPMSEWGEQLDSRIVRRAWLAGGWNTDLSGDYEMMTTLLGKDLSDAFDELSQAGRGADPIFTHIGNTWAVSSAEDSWDYGFRRVNSSDLQAIETAIQSVLGAIDPALELPIEDRWMAGIHGKARLHSSNLRQSLAATLALFGARGEQVFLGSGSTGRSWSEGVIYSLLERANKDSTGHLWSSLSDVLPLLAEAAPDVFLRAVQASLKRPNPLLGKLFLDQHDGFSIQSPHTGLLCAMETLAWSTPLFGLATELLAVLAEIDPGGRLSNRPSRSLANIFCLWMPQTSAGVKSRIKTLRALVSCHPLVGWTLLLDILPRHYGSGTYTHAPRFQDWKATETSVTHQELVDGSSAVAELILEIAEREPLRWTEVASRLADVPAPLRKQAYAQLQELSEQMPSDEVRTAIWERVGKEMRLHRAFPESAWALPATELDRIEMALEALKPADLVVRNRWLFDDHAPHIHVSRRDDHDAYDAAVARLRSAAVADILNHGGLAAVQSLASQAAQPWLVGMALASGHSNVVAGEVVTLLDCEDPKSIDFAFGYVVESSKGQIDSLLRFAETMDGRPSAQARLLNASDELEAAWAEAVRLGPEVDSAYWKEFRLTGRGVSFSLLNGAARHLLEHGRPTAALDLLALYRDQAANPPDAQLVVDAFEVLLVSEDPEIKLLTNYEIEQLLEFLRESQIEETVLASLEWRLLPALRFDASIPILERRLARDPKFFVEILSLIFKPQSREVDHEIHPRVSQNAFRLLHDWKLIPGSDEPEGEIDEDRLRAWMTEARTLLVEADREAVGEQYIGRVFAHSRVGDGNTWPASAVRNMIEESMSPNIELGLHIGTNHKRGVTMRGLDEGGEQEYALAEQYDRWAETSADLWPRTAAVLRSLAGGFRAIGRSHDEDARQFRAGLGR